MSKKEIDKKREELNRYISSLRAKRTLDKYNKIDVVFECLYGHLYGYHEHETNPDSWEELKKLMDYEEPK